MSPTSYQAAPPRDRERKCRADTSRVQGGLPGACPEGIRVQEAEQQLLVTHHAEVLTRNPLLRGRVGLDEPLERLERIDIVLERVDHRRHHALTLALTEQVDRGVLAAL